MQAGNTVVLFNLEVNRKELAQRGIRPPEHWQAYDVWRAESLGLVRTYAVDTVEAPDG